jgi:hypothetical protein
MVEASSHSASAVSRWWLTQCTLDWQSSSVGIMASLALNIKNAYSYLSSTFASATAALLLDAF